MAERVLRPIMHAGRVFEPGDDVPDGLSCDALERLRADGVIGDGAPAAAPEVVSADGGLALAGDPPIDLDALTVPELRALAAERGVDVPKRARKRALVKLLT